MASQQRMGFRTDFQLFVHDLPEAHKLITEVQHYLCDLREYRNSLTPMSQLPQDVFIEIVTQLAAAYDVCEPNSFYGRGRHRPHGWIAITHVCRSWRRTALRYPKLWHRIYTTSDHARVGAFLTRSAGCPLTFGAVDHSVYWDDNITTIFDKHGSRLGAALNVGISRDGAHALMKLTADRPLQLPQLELLRVRVTQGVNCVPALPDANMPRLTFLSCHSVLLPDLARWVRPTLTRLHFTGSNDEMTDPDAWISLLSELSLLEELHLLTHMTPIEPMVAQKHEPMRCAHLPKLREVRLGSSGGAAFTPDGSSQAYLLQHLGYPPNANVHLIGSCTTNSSPLDLSEYVLSCLAGPLATSHTDTPAEWAASRALQLTFTCNHVELSFCTSPIHIGRQARTATTCVSLHLGHREALPDCTSLLALAKQFCGSQAPLTFTVSGRRDPNVWRRAYEASFLGAHTLAVGAPAVRDLVCAVENACRNGPCTALSTVRRIRIVVWRKAPYGSLRNSEENSLLLRLISGLEELRNGGLTIESIDLGGGWIPLEDT